MLIASTLIGNEDMNENKGEIKKGAIELVRQMTVHRVRLLLKGLVKKRKREKRNAHMEGRIKKMEPVIACIS